MTSSTYYDIRSVFRFRVTTDYYGPSPMLIQTISVCAVNKSDAFTHVYNSFDNIYSVEFLECYDCVCL